VLRPCLASLLALLAACGPRPTSETAEEPPQVVLHGARLQSFEGERPVLTGTAERLTYWRIGGDVTATNAVLRMPARTGGGPRPASSQGGQTEIRAPRLDVSMASRVVTGTGGVEVRTPEGGVARAPTGTYDANAQRVRGTEGVMLTGPDYSVRADGFQLSLSDGTFTFEGSVQTVLGASQ
jgi:lipopolysaccharide export system protein LptC